MATNLGVQKRVLHMGKSKRGFGLEGRVILGDGNDLRFASCPGCLGRSLYRGRLGVQRVGRGQGGSISGANLFAQLSHVARHLCFNVRTRMQHGSTHRDVEPLEGHIKLVTQLRLDPTSLSRQRGACIKH